MLVTCTMQCLETIYHSYTGSAGCRRMPCSVRKQSIAATLQVPAAEGCGFTVNSALLLDSAVRCAVLLDACVVRGIFCVQLRQQAGYHAVTASVDCSYAAACPACHHHRRRGLQLSCASSGYDHASCRQTGAQRVVLKHVRAPYAASGRPAYGCMSYRPGALCRCMRLWPASIATASVGCSCSS